MTEDALYRDKRLVSVYDTINGPGEDSLFYMNSAGEKPIRILDSGCGTGMLAIKLALKGHIVTAIDPSSSMIKYAMDRKNSQSVNWIKSSIQNFRSIETFDLIIMTGHAFQCLLINRDIEYTFLNVKKLLNRKGRFIFETRNPAVKIWEEWKPENQLKFKTDDNLDFVMFHRLISAEDETIIFETTYRFSDNKEYSSKSRLRFASLKTITKIIEKTGLKIDSVYGDWDRSIFSEKQKEIIFTVSK